MNRQKRRIINIGASIIGGIINAVGTVGAGVAWMKYGGDLRSTYTGAVITLLVCLMGGIIGSRAFGFVAYFREDRCPFKVDIATRVIGGLICSIGLFIYRQQMLAQYNMATIEMIAIVSVGLVLILIEVVSCTISNAAYIRSKRRKLQA